MGDGCRNCGSPIRVDQFTALPCRHCGERSPLGTEEAKRLAELRTIAEQRVVSLEQWDRKVEELGRSLGSFELFGAICLWLIIGGTLIGMALSEVPDAGSLLLESPSVSRDVLFARWVMGSVGSALCISACCATLARWYGNQQRRFASALPPISEGSPPRCRRCGSSLPKGTGVRRCSYCHADSIVDARLIANLRASTKSELMHVREAAQRTMLQREVIGLRLRNSLFLPPFFLLVTFPVFWFLDSAPPLLWVWAALVCAPLSVVAFLVIPRVSGD